ncbi:DUF3419 family protein [Beijerinckia indica]|uniref:S-adenosylmethionine:diacylglycerol 3-amino-3-carboxypropyl transferase n=1 Tax=Beijerinckia indica subsp. indica (strain ATCC 9039 / DSM 1715 / NCIMB 8712) TaxID=395963 RepID=B2IBI5_BEII9|nr:DUF3419 family protein [Beijerinckia indica]ACB96611.1 conserved hypothetical protein [Beijerinckia indica subsp. indica ATCC 9039]
MTSSPHALRRTTTLGLRTAVHRSKTLSRGGLLEHLFTFVFRGLVYPQIWEDPQVDMEALAIRPDDHIVTIASGGCNVLSYLTANPRKITAVDLNGAHIALNRLKLAGLAHLPDHAAFFAFFGEADKSANATAYREKIRPYLDLESRAYWDSRGPMGRKRIDNFTDNFYRHGLLGCFIGGAHRLARLYGCDPRKIVTAKDRNEQRELFDTLFAPLFEKTFIRWLLRQPASLYGLGIPPSQYKALSGDLPGGSMADVVKERLRRLTCDFDLESNYFAWQAFARSYPPKAQAIKQACLPPYLMPDSFDALHTRVDRVDVRHESMTVFLRTRPAQNLDCYVLLDAQDWMNDEDLTALWGEILRTARPGARIIFRTAADERLLPGRVPASILDAFDYDETLCRSLGARDRSSIYGGFHLYRRKA